MAGLTSKQKVWLHCYLNEANLNATEAARMAGYSDPEVSGSENKRKPVIKEAIREALAARAMEPEEIISRLSDIARGTLDDFVDIDEDGPRLNMMKAKQKGLLHTFETIRYTRNGLEVKRYSAADALEKLARVHKLFGDQAVQVDIKIINVILDALPPDFRQGVVDALASQFEIVGQAPALPAMVYNADEDEG